MYSHIDAQTSFIWQDFKNSNQGLTIIGVDEAGRGCLAGPVFAAAVAFLSDQDTSLYRDSKTLSAKKREDLARSIQLNHLVGIGIASVFEIEKLNILQASLLAMHRAIEKIAKVDSVILVDGNQKIKSIDQLRQITIVKGDQRAAPIAAASIVAKVARDQYVERLQVLYPNYGFSAHKGYATELHRTAIAQHAPCPEHRRTFAGVKEHWPKSFIPKGPLG